MKNRICGMVTVILVILFACPGRATMENNTVLKVSSMMGNLWDSTISIYEKKSSHVTVEISENPLSNQDIIEKLINKDQSIDVYAIQDTSIYLIPLLKEKELFANLAENAEIESVVESMYPVFSDFFRVDDMICAFPYNIKFDACYFFDDEVAKVTNYRTEEIPENLIDLAEAIIKWDTEMTSMYPDYGLETGIAKVPGNPYFDVALSLYEYYCLKEYGSIQFDTPLFRKVMSAIDPLKNDMEENEDNIIFDSGPDEGILYISMETPADLIFYPWKKRLIKPLALTSDTSNILPVSFSCFVVNPYSMHKQEAMDFISVFASQMDMKLSYCLSQDRINPVENASYEKNVSDAQSAINEYEEKLKNCPPEDKKRWESQLEIVKNVLKSAEQNRFDITVDAIQDYKKNIVPYIFILGNSPYETSGIKDQIRKVFSMYTDGAIGIDETVSQLDKVIKMQALEGGI